MGGDLILQSSLNTLSTISANGETYYYHIHFISIILLTKTPAAQNEVALSYHKVRGLYFLAVIFAMTINSIASPKKGTNMYAYSRKAIDSKSLFLF